MAGVVHLGHRRSNEQSQHCRPICDPLHLWLEPIPLAAVDHYQSRNEHHREGHQTDVPFR